MLTVPPSLTVAPRQLKQRRTRAVLAAIVPIARVSHLGPAAATVVLAAIPAVVTMARGDAMVSAPLTMASLVAAASLGWGTDDPTANLLSSTPIPTSLRATLRIALVATVAALGMALITIVVAVGPGLPSDLGDRVPEGAASASLALAVGFIATRRGERAAGPIAVTAGVLGTVVVAAFAFRWPTLFPSFMPDGTHDRWWIVTAGCVVVIVRAGRDPGRR